MTSPDTRPREPASPSAQAARRTTANLRGSRGRGAATDMTGLLHNVPLPPGQAVGLVVGAVLDRFHPARLPGLRIAYRLTGAPLMVAGCALIVWALAERRRRTTGGFDLERPQSLVTTGPYAWSHHPMYVGWWLIHLGFGVMRGSAWVLVTLPVAIVAEHRGVRAEERALVQTFGPQFLRYAEQVALYLPVRQPRTSDGPECQKYG